MEDWRKFQQAVDKLKADLLREAFAPLYRTFRFKKTAEWMVKRADELDRER